MYNHLPSLCRVHGGEIEICHANRTPPAYKFSTLSDFTIFLAALPCSKPLVDITVCLYSAYRRRNYHATRLRNYDGFQAGD